MLKYGDCPRSISTALRNVEPKAGSLERLTKSATTVCRGVTIFLACFAQSLSQQENILALVSIGTPFEFTLGGLWYAATLRYVVMYPLYAAVSTIQVAAES